MTRHPGHVGERAFFRRCAPKNVAVNCHHVGSGAAITQNRGTRQAEWMRSLKMGMQRWAALHSLLSCTFKTPHSNRLTDLAYTGGRSGGRAPRSRCQFLTPPGSSVRPSIRTAVTQRAQRLAAALSGQALPRAEAALRSNRVSLVGTVAGQIGNSPSSRRKLPETWLPHGRKRADGRARRA